MTPAQDRLHFAAFDVHTESRAELVDLLKHPNEWYAREARRAVTPIAATLAEALAIVRPFLDPLLDNTAAGAWDPAQQTWRSS